MKKKKVVLFEQPILLDLNGIQELLPHRGLALMLDEGEIWGPQFARGLFEFTPEKYPFFEGHFPGNPVVRAVDLIEILGLTASLLVKTNPDLTGLVGMFRKVASAKFSGSVKPGDILEACVTITNIRGDADEGFSGSFKGKGRVGENVAIELSANFIAVSPEMIDTF